MGAPSRAPSALSLGARPTSQRRLERLLDSVDVHELESLALVRGNLGDVALVALRNDDPLDPGPLGGQRLLLQAADRQHLAGQCDLAANPAVRAHRLAGDQ